MEVGMLKDFSQYVVYSLFAMEQGRLAGALEFFIYDTIKIFLLLFRRAALYRVC